MDDDPKKDIEQPSTVFHIRMNKEDKALYTKFAKDQKMTMTEIIKTAIEEYMVNKGYVTESKCIGILEKFGYYIVRVPKDDKAAFRSLVSHLKKKGYQLWGKPFDDTAGCVMQFMVLNQTIGEDKQED
jgi:hypothetical protein